MDAGAGTTGPGSVRMAFKQDQDVAQKIAVAMGMYSLAAAFRARCMEDCEVGPFVCFKHNLGDLHAESWALKVMLVTRTARRLIQEAYLALRQGRQWHAWGGQLLTVRGSGPLQPFIDKSMIIEGAMVQGRIRTITVEAAGLSVCLGWHTHLLACVAASFRLPDRRCCAMSASVHKCREFESPIISAGRVFEVKLAALGAIGCMPIN